MEENTMSGVIEEMEHPPGKRLKTSSEIIQVRHSSPFENLGDDMIEHILSFLPMREVFENSTLAKRFERSWQLCHHLCFDRSISKGHSPIQVASIIDHVLSSHLGKKIITFELCVNPVYIEPLIIPWIESAISKEPRVLSLDFILARHRSTPYNIPFDVIDIESIRVLRLSFCRIELPPKFKGLHLLRTIQLRYVLINSTSNFIDVIFENCLFLESLDIVRCFNVHELTIVAKTLKFFKELKIGDCLQLDSVYIDAPTLEVFHYIGKPYDIAFKGRMTNLKDVMLNYKALSYVFLRYQTEKFILQLFSNVQVLTVSSPLLEDLCSNFIHGSHDRGAERYLWHVKELQLLMETTSFCNPYDIVCFAHKCPHLERLFIDFQKFSFVEKNLYWEVKDKPKFNNCDKQFPFLKLVKFSCFKFTLMELKLVKFFLEKSPNLENLAIFTTKNYRVLSFSNAALNFLQLLVSWRSSPRAKVGVYEYSDKENQALVPKHLNPWYEV